MGSNLAPSLIRLVFLSAALLILAGATLRFIGLGEKFYWVDEVNTSIHAVGTTKPEISAILESDAGKTVSLGLLRDLIERPADGKGLAAPISVLIRDDPHHPPLYYLFARAWIPVAGGSPAALRLLSACLSLLALPGFYWLCREMAWPRWLATLGTGLFAVSPFQLIYAQQAREYGLSAGLLLASTAALIRASGSGRVRDWAGFALLSVLSLYTSLFALPVLACQAYYGLWFHRRDLARIRPLLFSCGAIVAAFLPWLWIVVSQAPRVVAMNSGSAEPITPLLYAQTLVLNFARPFLDIDLPSYVPLPLAHWPVMAAIGAILAVEAVAVLSLLRRGDRRQNRVMLALGSVGLLLPLAADLALGGRRALIPRYDLPTWLALHFLIAGFLGSGLASASHARRRTAGLCFLFLAACGLASTAIFLSAPNWWTARPIALAEAADTLKGVRIDALIARPRLQGVGLISFAESLPAETPLIFLDPAGEVDRALPDSLLLYDPPDELLHALERGYTLAEVVPDSYVWHAIRLPADAASGNPFAGDTAR
jgi:uncharacterized membrane protein